MSDEGSLPPGPTPGLKPPRFRLLTMFLAMTLIATILAAGQLVGVYGTFWIVVFALAIMAHVAGNSLGTQLRDSSPAGRRTDAEYPRHLPRPGSQLDSSHFAAPSKLNQRRSLGWLVLVVPVVGFLVAGGTGGYWLTRENWQDSTAMSMICSVLACGTLGAIGGFLMASFAKVMLDSIWEASRH